MTEKRFKFRDTIDNEVFLKKRICDDYTNKSYDSTLKDQEDLCEILNELNDDVVKGDLFKLTVAMAIQHRINWLKKQIWDNTDRIDELQSLKKELKL